MEHTQFTRPKDTRVSSPPRLDRRRRAPAIVRAASVSEYSQTYSTRVAAAPAECFAVLTASRTTRDWSSPITRLPRARPPSRRARPARRVPARHDHQDVPLRPRRTPTTRRARARWRLVEGDVQDVEGAYRFDEADGATTATCTQAIDLGFWVPGFSAAHLRAEGAARFGRGVPARGRESRLVVSSEDGAAPRPPRRGSPAPRPIHRCAGSRAAGARRGRGRAWPHPAVWARARSP